MDDRLVENLLKRYRPVGPPDSLRERCLVTPREAPVWPWATAAAALFAITVGLQNAAAGAMSGANIALAVDARAEAVAALAEALGGDTGARELAEQIIDQQMRRDQEQVARSTTAIGEMP